MSTDGIQSYGLEKMAVLVVDDKREMRSLLKAILNTLHIRNVFECADAASAFKQIQINSIDLIITDWHMEPLDGIEFARLIRTARDSPNPYVPVIMVSGHTEYRHICAARDAGINEFLAKPISVKALQARILNIIAHPRAFIRTKTYFGPDRRRKNLGPPRGLVERRIAAPSAD